MQSYHRLLPLVLLSLLCTCDRAQRSQTVRESESQTVSGHALPNILFILTDDQGIGDLSLHGNDSIQTPNMDMLLQSSVRFDRFYVSPVCAPTRASFLSGLYAPRTGAIFVTRRRETMDDGIMTIPEYLRHAEYRTGLFGKWHNGATAPYDPGSQGFEKFLGFTLGHFNDYFSGELENEKNEIVPFSGDLTQILTDSAAHFMLQESPYPFFCMLTYQAPHTPVQVADKYWDKVKKRGLTDYNTGIYAMIESVDDRIGQLLDQLENAGKLDNTIVIFSTDNGPNGDRYRMGLKGTKGQVDEGGVRVPFGIRMPKGHPANGKVFTNPAAHVDLVPTLLELVDLPIPEELDGRSLLPLIEGKKGQSLAGRYIYAFKQGYDFTGYPGSVRNERYLLVAQKRDHFEFYDLLKDEGQQRDLTGVFGGPELVGQDEIQRKMMKAYQEKVAAVTPDSGLIAPPIDLDAARDQVRLLAHEGEPLGKTRFKDQYGWANDFFVDLDWNGAMWPVSATKSRDYEVTIAYHAERPVRFGIQVDDKTDGLVFQEIPVALTEQLPVPDRVTRKEVYPRKWGSATIERFTIPAGARELHIFGGYNMAAPTGLWIKEITLRPLAR